ncbi:terminase large subunit domain-containing protein [Ralstonia pseudosolanacearum]|uniref:terminase large subunit domain-containing protein n=1 Tax=Ralstonia pseudosolanacearum TaxID=1310165 RepID=UPI00201D9CC9|nr:terminase family protein [Ralstonia pseudosolanacearum]UQY83673.1 terminase family protein [Ralstonia pseudosolanacearum]
MSDQSEKLQQLARDLEELQRRQRENRLAYYGPYAKQREFHALGATRRERMFLAGNQLGKTFSGGAEMAMHLTGRYPDWWEGRRFTGQIRAWAAGITSESVRDTVQRILLGPLGQQGTGSIPKEAIIEVRNARGIPDAVDTILVRHKDGGTSQVTFKSYERGREKLQGETLDVIWLDEEPPEDIYSEALARIAARSGIVYLTATPLLGMTQVVRRFLNEASPDRGHVTMTIDDAAHITPEDRARIIAGYAPHEREARVKGIPMLGSGRVFPVAEEMITEEAFAIPKYWPRIVGLDFGWDHPTAAVWIAWDRDADVVHITDAYRVREQTVIVHAASIKARSGRAADWMPVAWPHDGMQADKGSGETLSRQYKNQGLRMLDTHAQHPDGGNSVEAGVMDMLDRMQTGRLKVASHLADWFEEFRLYHRDNGKLVKEYDDLLSATRYALMMLRSARTQPDYSQSNVRMASGLDYNPLDPHGDSGGDRGGHTASNPGVVWGNGRPAHLDRPRRNGRTASGTDFDPFGS